jgi:hypothetical protein
MLVGPFDGAKCRISAGDIQSQRQQRIGVLGLEVVERARVTRRGGDAVAALQRRLCPLATEAARSPGYEPCLVSADFRAARSALLFGVVEVEAAVVPPGDGGVGEVG